MNKNLLIELGTEELPPKALDELSQAFADGIAAGLAKRGVAFYEAGVMALNSPRRLAVHIEDVALTQPEQKLERRGPAMNAGIGADGQPSKALIGFAASCGVTVEQLEKLETDKGSWFVHRSTKEGSTTSALLPEIIDEALKALPIPKPMRWSDKEFQFVRPAHWLVVLLGDEVVPATVLGISSDRMSRGHRFHHPQTVWISNADSYIDSLRSAHVLVSPNERRQRVQSEVERVAGATGGRPRLREDLLDEVKNLVEWPVAIACTFERDFLKVPQEALIMTMESNQKFFPVFDAHGQLTEHFIGIANIESKDPSEIRKGYERVIRPRFADAKFFFDDDLKTPLASQQEALKNVTYQAKLGTVWDKVCRVAELARVIAGRVGVDAASATKAAALAKCDLMTRMVGEFPELQGIMGRTYALAQGESLAVAAALDEFYQPRFAGDAIAPSPLGQVLALAEKLDTLAGMFAIGQKPTGNKDPFSLRRNALGLARTLVEGKLDLDLRALLLDALSPLAQEKASALADELYEFVLERLRGYFAELGTTPQQFDAVAALKPVSLLDFAERLRAVRAFSALPAAGKLAAANKRCGNILKQAAEKNEPIPDVVPASSLELDAERALAAALASAQTDTTPLFAARDYVAALTRLAELQEPIDSFFDGVMVMDPDAGKRANRLGLLAQMRRLFTQVAAIDLL
ncbi:MAG: glycine--tRNA ligase subunit beta [Ahniella sp.]|nr:glycine--tRNA ligase subunit beta [Ahniella sp.]